MARTYYTLVSRVGNRWCPEFGDYKEDVVKQELEDMLDGTGYKRKDLKVIKHGDKQADMMAAVAKLNEGL